MQDLEELEGSEKNFIRELECNPARKYRINNLTAERITIGHYTLKERDFFVPGFGSRYLSSNTLLDMDYPGWENQGLIQIIDVTDELQKPEIQNTASESLMGLTLVLLAFFLIIGIPFALNQSNPWIWAVIGAVTHPLSFHHGGNLNIKYFLRQPVWRIRHGVCRPAGLPEGRSSSTRPGQVH